MVQSDYFVAFVLFMSKKIFNHYKELISRCQSPSELLDISKAINDSPELSKNHKVALAVSCIFVAKYFDKKGIKNETVSLDSSSSV